MSRQRASGEQPIEATVPFSLPDDVPEILNRVMRQGFSQRSKILDDAHSVKTTSCMKVFEGYSEHSSASVS